MSNVTPPSSSAGADADSTRALEAELAALRARAYGRDADIHGDPEALRRLAELENAARGAANAAAAAGASVGGDQLHTAPLAEPQHPMTVSTSEATPELEISTGVAAADEDEVLEIPASTPRSRWSWMLRPPVWIASLALTAAITAVVTTMIVTYDPTVVARLHAIPQEEWPETLGDYGLNEDLQVFEEFKGLTTIAGAIVVDGQSNMMCLYLVAEGGYATGSCQGEGIEPRLDFTVGNEHGVAFREAFPEGTAARITLEGDTVVMRAVATREKTAER